MTDTRDAKHLIVETLQRLTLEIKSDWTRVPESIHHDEFEAGVRPILRIGIATIEAAKDQAWGVEDVDVFVLAVLEAVRTSVRFTATDRPRALLYSILIARELAAMPSGRSTIRTIQESIEDDIRLLYAELGPEWRAIDPTVCWFTEGAVADPQASLIVDLCKVTSLTYNQYDSVHVAALVPRSKLAKWIHAGKKADLFDPNWLPQRLREESLARVRSDRDMLDERVREIESSFAAIELAEKRATQARVAELEAQLVMRQAARSQATAEAEAECQRVAIAERKRVEADLEELSQRCKPSISGARRRSELLARWPFLQFEVPLVAAGAAGSLFFVDTVGIGYALAIGALLGSAVGFTLRRVIRGAPVRIERRFRRELNSIRARGDARVTSLRMELDAELSTVANAITAERDEIIAQSEDMLRETRRMHDEQIAAVRAEAATGVATVETAQQQAVTAKLMKDSDQHPAIRMGLENEFLRGRAPSKGLIKVMHDHKYSGYLNSLSPTGRASLIRERNRLSRDEFDQLMERLIS